MLSIKCAWYACFVLQNYISLKRNDDKMIVFDRNDKLVFIFNFHPSKSYADYKIGVPTMGTYPWQLFVVGVFRMRLYFM